jgi:hypothetical protein
LPLAILGVTAVVSYERAKAEALGLEATGGLMERAERMILLGFGFLAASFLVPVLWVLLGLTTLTAAGRFLRVWRAASTAPIARISAPATAPSTEAETASGDEVERIPTRIALAPWGHGRVESRWRTWRASERPRTPLSRTGEPFGRWRARRQEALASRSRRARRNRRPERSTRFAARHGLVDRSSRH